jgi:hypothetical protein
MFRPCPARRAPRGWLRPLAPALAVAALFAAPAARAVSFTSVTTAFAAGNSTDLLVDTNPPPVTRVRNRSLGVVSSSANAFQTRYAMLVGTDAGQIAPLGSLSETFTANYTITLSILGAPGEHWQVVLETSRVGALTIVHDGNGSASATLGAVTGSATGGTLTGSLGLAAVGTTTNAGAPTTSPNTAFDQSSSAVVAGVGTGAVQTVTLSFSWTASTTSTRQGNNADEAAVRMGRTSTASFYTADDYPGAGSRTQSLDGHFVSATLIPEPDTALLLASGLVGLAWSSRRRG